MVGVLHNILRKTKSPVMTETILCRPQCKVGTVYLRPYCK